jgi:predicted outer membrane protein
MARIPRPQHSPAMVPSRRLEDKIRQLCAQAIAAPPSEFDPAIAELKVALHEHTERLRQLAASKLARSLRLRSQPSLPVR